MTLKLKELTLGVALASVSAGAFAYNEETGRTDIHNGLGDVADAVSRRDGEEDRGPLHPLKNVDGNEPEEAPIESTFVGLASNVDGGFTENGFPLPPINTVDQGVGGGLTQLAAMIDGNAPAVPEELQSALDPIDDAVNGEEQTDPEPTLRDGEAGSVAVTVSGSVNDALSCTIGATSGTEFTFPDMITDTGVVATGSTVDFSVDCADENSRATSIYLTTNGEDPRNSTGSNVITATYSDNDDASGDVEILVFADTNGDKETGTAIGTGSPEYTTDGTGGPGAPASTAVSLYATIDTAQLGDGGSIAGDGITVWFD